MHWLTGTNQHTKLFKLWKKVGAMDEKSNLYQGDYFYKSSLDGKSISLYHDYEKTRLEMYYLSPKDIEQIDLFIDTISMLSDSYQDKGFFSNIFNTIKGYTKVYRYYANLSLEDLAFKFKHLLLKKLFTDYLPKEYSSLFLLCSYASFTVEMEKFIIMALEFQITLKIFLELCGNSSHRK